jgi:hypothetical protein
MGGLIHLIAHLAIWLSENRVKRWGSVRKAVRCENCTLPYEYEMRRTVRLHGEASKEMLAAEAERRLRKQLATECDLVACPSCGWYQQHMIEQARNRATRHVPGWVVFVVIVTALSATYALLCACDPPKFGPVGVWIGVACGALATLGALIIVVFVARRIYLSRLYNPNSRRWQSARQEQ